MHTCSEGYSWHRGGNLVSALLSVHPDAVLQRQEKLEFMFQIYDVDGDGVVTASDLQLMLPQMAGSTLRYAW
jgi:Ca2+-binding EF-hand superfamily protein